MLETPDGLYFRTRDNGAAVFRVDTQSQQHRLDVSQIATINISKGEFRGQGDAPPTKEEEVEIKDWIEKRQAVLAERQIDDIHRAIDMMNATAQWVQSKATNEDIDKFAQPLLLAMNDLRTVLVRNLSDRAKDKAK
ncbi:MAG: hypothetical protein AAF429_02125 [Pseudomonadota bacterium]